MPSELLNLNARVTEFETYYGNLELTAQTKQNEIITICASYGIVLLFFTTVHIL